MNTALILTTARIARLESVLGKLLAAADHAIDDWSNMANDCDQSQEPEAAAEYRGYAEATGDALDEARALLGWTNANAREAV